MFSASSLSLLAPAFEELDFQGSLIWKSLSCVFRASRCGTSLNSDCALFVGDPIRNHFNLYAHRPAGILVGAKRKLFAELLHVANPRIMYAISSKWLHKVTSSLKFQTLMVGRFTLDQHWTSIGPAFPNNSSSRTTFFFQHRPNSASPPMVNRRAPLSQPPSLRSTL